MKISIGLMALTVSVIGLSFGSAYGSGEWIKVMDKDGIQSFSRSVPGSDILEFRAVTVINAPIEVVGEVVRDLDHYPEWVPFVSGGKILEMTDRNDMTVYIYLDFPWPVNDRDIVTSARTEYYLDRGRGVTTIMNARLNACPLREGVIRLPEFNGTYVFEYITRHLTGVIYTYRADIGGKVPVSLVNTFSRRNMFWTFENLKKMAALPRYRELGEASPDRDVVGGVLNDPEKRKAVVIARLREFVGSEPFLDMLTAFPDLADLAEDSDGQASRDMLYGWGSEQGKKDAIKSVLSAYLKKKNATMDRIQTAVSNQTLINAILTGTPVDYCAPCVIEEYHRDR